MKTFFLQISEIAQAASPTMWQRLADQAISLAILGLISWVLWKRQKDLEDKLTQYLDEDRKSMLDVIQNNTNVMQQLNEHFEKLEKK